jgi:hypothetical protein
MLLAAVCPGCIFERRKSSASPFAVRDWQARQQTRAPVQRTIRFTLNELPEEPYPEPVWNKKVDAVWAYILNRPQQVR